MLNYLSIEHFSEFLAVFVQTRFSISGLQ